MEIEKHKTRLEEIDRLLKLNGDRIHLSQLYCGLPVGEGADRISLWGLIDERCRLSVEKAFLERDRR